MPRYLADLTVPQFAKEMEIGTPIILPLGATEEHGDHLPLSTDTVQPIKIAEMVSDKTGALIAPPIPYGNCSTTRNFPGTISIDTETLRMLVFEILMEFGRHGAKGVIVLSGHAGSSHMAALKEAAKDFVYEYECKTMVLSDYDIAYRLKGEFELPEKDGHGGMIETSRVMAICPELVGKGEDHIPEFPSFRVMKDPQKHFPKGIMGFPSRASAELGQRMNDAITRELSILIKEMMEE